MSNFNDMEDLENLPPSKTKRKEQMNELQDLGVELIKMGKDKLKKLELPETLFEAIKEAQRLTAHGAIRRQYQYIGKLMRNDVDADELRQKINYLNGDSIQATQTLHLSERWRDRLLDDDSALQSFIDTYQGFDISELRSLVRLVRKERDNMQNKNFTKLFRFIKTIIESDKQ